MPRDQPDVLGVQRRTSITTAELSPTQREIKLSALCIARPEAILTVERLDGGIFGIDNYYMHTERVPHKQNAFDSVLKQ